jgi:hypothetical protein
VKHKPKRIDVTKEQLDALLERAQAALESDDVEIIRAMAETITLLSEAVDKKGTSIKRLLKMVFGASTEKTRRVLEEALKAQAGTSSQNPTASQDSEKGARQDKKKKRKGHGRNGACEYSGANKVCIAHESLKSGNRCPDCMKGKVYPEKMPKILIRVVGQAPLQATVYEVEKMRCNLCGKIFTAPIPEGIGEEKYDDTSASMIALLKYGSGFPFYRMQKLQAGLGLPVPASTQWEIVEGAADKIYPAYEELVRQAAQGEVLHNDDTGMKVLALMKENQSKEESDDRKGIFTSGIVSTQAGRKIALFFTGRKHAGENLADVLKKRAAELDLPIQMCDALSRNPPKGAETQLANCLTHSRRKFVDVANSFTDECRHVLETLKEVYKNDAFCKEQQMTPAQRLQFHQDHSGSLMRKLRKWLADQFENKKVEPNSGLGDAISYMLKHWDKLTLFLEVPGAPLDNNTCEIALKKAILHRKNALFYKTEHGAYIGDLFMSLIYTCELCDANAFDYLTALQRHSKEVFANAQDWMPWNYKDATTQAAPAPQA